MLCRLSSQEGAVLLDVRPAEQYNICHLPGGSMGGRAGWWAGSASQPDSRPAPSSLLRHRLVNLSSTHTRHVAPHPAGALHTPYKHFDRHLDAIRQCLAEAASPSSNGSSSAAEEQQQAPPPLYVVCRRGNDSQRAVAALRAAGVAHAVDVVGGMEAWAAEVDPGFPTY